MQDLRQRVEELVRNKEYYNKPAVCILTMGIISMYIKYHFYYEKPTGCPLTYIHFGE